MELGSAAEGLDDWFCRVETDSSRNNPKAQLYGDFIKPM